MPPASDMVENQHNQLLNYGKVAVIPDGGNVSGVVDLGGMTLVGFFCPGDLDGQTVSFYARPSLDGSTYGVAGADGTVVTVAGIDATYFALDPTKFAGIRYLLVGVGSNVSADVSVVLALRRV